MSAQEGVLKNKGGDEVYANTLTRKVYDNTNGNRLDQIIDGIEAALGSPNIGVAADVNYAAGEHIYHVQNKELYKAKTLISQGATFNKASGGNVDVVSLGDEIMQLNSHKVNKTDMAWKFHKNLSTTTAQALPSSFNELLLVGKYGNQRPTLYIPQTMLSANGQFFIWGTESSTTAAVTVSSSTVTATGVWYQGTAETTNIDVYYR